MMHHENIIEAYVKLHQVLSFDDQHGKKILDILLENYATGYEKGEEETRQRVYFFHPESWNKDDLWKKCKSRCSLNEMHEEEKTDI